MLTNWSLPAGVVAVVAILIAVPNGFPYHKSREKCQVQPSHDPILRIALKRLDLVGGAMLLAATLLLTTALLEGGVEWEWNSAASISMLVVAGALWIAFFWWEMIVSTPKWTQEPVFPSWFWSNCQLMGLLL